MAALALKKAGWSALKFYPFGGPQVITQERIARGVELVRAVREAVGPGMEIGIDVRARLDPWSAGRVSKRPRRVRHRCVAGGASILSTTRRRLRVRPVHECSSLHGRATLTAAGSSTSALRRMPVRIIQ